MTIFTVKIKWQKKLFEEVSVDTGEVPLLFKNQLYSLTGVPPDRQKVMLKGGMLKDDSWGTAVIKNGMVIMMMGSAEALPFEPSKVQKAKEEMDIEEEGLIPPGLVNLQNTCYMNSTLQCLHSIPELKMALSKYQISLSPATEQRAVESALARVTGKLFNSMDNHNVSRLTPVFMLQALHSAFPQFAAREKGVLMQQDAMEFWLQLLNVLRDRMSPIQPVEGNPNINFRNLGEKDPQSDKIISPYSNAIDQYFSIEHEETLVCEEDKEDVTKKIDSSPILDLHIDQNTKYLHTCMKNWSGYGLEPQTKRKRSQKLDKECNFKVTKKITRLPAYLTVEFVRFFYKQKKLISGQHEGINAKILKDIKFPAQLDVYDFVSPQLQSKLNVMRGKFKTADDAKIEQQVKKIKTMDDTAKPSTRETSKNIYGLSSNSSVHPYWFDEDPGSNNSGFYELQAVLTHQGRSSNSGHYVGWTKYRPGEWLKFDDEEVSPIREEDVLRLSGGGDWHMAYVLIYGPRILEASSNEQSEVAQTSATDEPMPQTDISQEQPNKQTLNQGCIYKKLVL